MTTLDERFDQAKELPVPELRSDVDRRLEGPTPTTPEEGPTGPTTRQRLLAGGVAGAIFIVAAALFWFTAHNAPGGPASSDVQDQSNVLLVRCDAQSIEVLTPVVVAQPDGLHVKASVTGLTDPDVSVRSSGDPLFAVASGGSDVDSEFVRDLPPGDATVHCESGPWQGDGPEDLEASFSFIDPNGVFTDYLPSCADALTLEPREPSMSDWIASQEETLSPIETVLAQVTGIQSSDVVERAGYAEVASERWIIRVTRDGQIIGSFFGSPAGGGSFIHYGRVCSSSGLAYR
jgi:hypothetical protein